MKTRELLKCMASQGLRAMAGNSRWPRRWLARWGMRSDRSIYKDKIVTSWYGANPIRLCGLDQNYLSFQLFWQGADRYEPETSLLVMDLLEDADAFIDIGANMGVFSLLAASQYPSLPIIAFEPNPKMSRILEKNIDLNHFGNVRVEKYGIYDRNSSEKLFICESDMSASLASEWRSSAEEVSIETVTLDDYLQGHTFRHGIIKIDVEGVEEPALYGARQLLESEQPDIILEVVHPYSEAFQSWLHAIGYRFFHLTPYGYDEKPQLVDPYSTQAEWKFHNYLISKRPAAKIRQLYEKHRDYLQSLPFETIYAH